MRKIEDVLRLHAQGMSTRRFALATGVRNTSVIEYLRRAALAGLVAGQAIETVRRHPSLRGAVLA